VLCAELLLLGKIRANLPPPALLPWAKEMTSLYSALHKSVRGLKIFPKMIKDLWGEELLPSEGGARDSCSAIVSKRVANGDDCSTSIADVALIGDATATWSVKKAEPLQVEQERKRCLELKSLPPEETVGAIASNTEDRYDVTAGDSTEKTKRSRAFH